AVIEEDAAPDGVAALWVGPTSPALAAGLAGTEHATEAWIVRSVPRGLVLCGGGPRGTLYAVYHFLEDVLGVRWWTPYAESVPRRRALVLARVDRRGQPAFVYRDVHGIDGPSAFRARNRLNGDAAEESFGPPFGVHTFAMYVPPEKYFAAHPEYFSEIGGLRYGGRAQLCLTNPELRQLIVEKLRGSIAAERAAAAAAGREPARLFALSQNDWGRRCGCSRCRAVEEREGAASGVQVEFINAVADAIAASDPDVRLDTLAYSFTFQPPRHVVYRDNVILRVAALYERDFSKPIEHPDNRACLEALEGWRGHARHLRVWDYAVTYGEASDLPLPNLAFLAADYRAYLARGVEGVFVQHDDPLTADLGDLKVWVLLKLLEDPARDPDALIGEFVRGYYGAAAEPIRRWVGRLAAAAQRRP
ncbi:MAG TPA: DUF4838 domain-containing protein, partial [Candidatus Polarisedimenticolaceae bacterium]|nr:DUF4838 domain-containing protein [Candidatus Polarisedimenticolaceae bacterium]